MQIATAFPLKLAEALAPLGQPRQCALLNYPNHLNIGDHLIWAGTVDYLRRVTRTHIAYTADLDTFSSRALNRALAPGDPILLHGGGSLGDLWPDRQQFHERIAAAHRERPLILLPQSVHFADPALARRAAEAFNGHGDLTIFARDRHSHSIASALFSACRVYLAPDMVFQLAGRLGASKHGIAAAATTLWLARGDREAAPGDFGTAASGFVRQDWVSYDRKWRWGNRRAPFSRTIARWYREIWQRGLSHPEERRERAEWLRVLPAVPDCAFSMSLVADGCRQLSAHRAVIADRLHAHLLATLLGIPNVLRANSDAKNSGFFETWMREVPWCRFAANASELPPALDAAIASRPEGEPF